LEVVGMLFFIGVFTVFGSFSVFGLLTILAIGGIALSIKEKCNISRNTTSYVIAGISVIIGISAFM
jgi:hypothetical protein